MAYFSISSTLLLFLMIITDFKKSYCRAKKSTFDIGEERRKNTSPMEGRGGRIQFAKGPLGVGRKSLLN